MDKENTHPCKQIVDRSDKTKLNQAQAKGQMQLTPEIGGCIWPKGFLKLRHTSLKTATEY